jgi:hypothetical protein
MQPMHQQAQRVRQGAVVRSNAAYDISYSKGRLLVVKTCRM